MSVIRLWLLLFVCVCAYFQIGLEMIVWQDRPPTKWLIINNNTIKYLPAEWQRKKIINHSIAPTYYPVVIYLSVDLIFSVEFPPFFRLDWLPYNFTSAIKHPKTRPSSPTTRPIREPMTMVAGAFIKMLIYESLTFLLFHQPVARLHLHMAKLHKVWPFLVVKVAY
jgi:hypothetical protein